MVFKQIGSYKGYTFVNIESASYEELQRDLELKEEVQASGIPEDETEDFCKWLKELSQPYVSKVTVSKRLTDAPLVLFSHISSHMRQM